MKNIRPKQLKVYATKNGQKPFIEWLEGLKDKTARYRIKERLDRLSLGNFGDYKTLGDGLLELRLAFGSGYRVYLGEENHSIVLLLCGGDKSSQRKDIKDAKIYWKDYLSR